MAQQLQLGHYRLSRTLGIGAFGKVKLAEHIVTNQKVAIKILNKAKVRELDMVEKVKREINILRACKHPHIIRLYEVIDTPTDTFVIMEYVPNGELFDYIVTRGRLSTNEARQIFQQLISSIEYCHYKKIVHRDLKPENLLLDQDNNIKVADFGLSNICHDGEFLKTSCGSPNYAAPEIISGNLYAGPEVDVWSCGVVLYALLCGSLPFDNDSIPLLFKEIKEGRYSIPPHVDLVATDLIRRMLVVDPLKRFSLAEVKSHPWFKHKLSPYLTLQPFELEEEEKELDMDVVSQVAALSFPYKSSKPYGNRPFEGLANSSAIQIEGETSDQNSGEEEEEVSNHNPNLLSASYTDPPHPSFFSQGSDEENQMVEDGESRSRTRNRTASSDIGGDPFSTIGNMSGSLPEEDIEKIEELNSTMPLFPSDVEEGVRERTRSYHVNTVVGAIRGSNPRNDLRVAYELLLDVKRRKRRVSEQNRILGMSHSSTTPSFPISPLAPSSIDLFGSPLSSSSSPLTTPQFTPNLSALEELLYTDEQATNITQFVRARRWYLGIQSKRDPGRVMREVFQALSNLGFVWKVITPYRIICQRSEGEEGESKSNSEEEPSNKFRIALSLYKVHSKVYLLDFQKTTGSQFTFMITCENIISELKRLSKAQKTS